MEELRVVDFEQHASDLSSELWVHGGDEREETLAQHLFLLLWGSRGQHGGRQRLLALHVHSLGWGLKVREDLIGIGIFNIFTIQYNNDIFH